MALSMTEPKAFSLTYVLNGTVNSPSINVYFSESLVMVSGLSFLIAPMSVQTDQNSYF